MAKDVKAFLKTKRQTSEYRPVYERLKDYKEVMMPRSEDTTKDQAHRCMDCGTPFCHWGCPVGNYIPEWNDLVMAGQWERAFELLDATNNLPEMTGRVCPAPCEYSCVLGINDDPITIRENELGIIEHGFKKGYIKAQKPKKRTAKTVAIVGSGPAGLACAAQLNKAGHTVTVFERDDKPGGVLRYGIPDFKLEKWVIDRRIKLMKKEGVIFKNNIDVGSSKFPSHRLQEEFDAVCLTGGSRIPRDLKIEGREYDGIHFAMDYLIQNNKRVMGKGIPRKQSIHAKDKRVVVIGGGDTGADCVGTAHRQGAKSVVQIEVMPKPAECRTDDYPWPRYPLLLKSSTSHQEGGERQWSVLTKKFIARKGKVVRLLCAQVEFKQEAPGTCPVMKEIPGSEFEVETDLVILAIGFVHPEHAGLLTDLHIETDQRGNVKTGDDFMTSTKGIFTAGDMHRGQSLIVWAISEGRQAAHHIDNFLMGSSQLPII